MLPHEIENIIFEFHDEYGLIEKKQLIHYIIRKAYQTWLASWRLDEYSCKQEIFPYVSSNMFVTNRTCWMLYLAYFDAFERFVSENKNTCFPGCHS